jgi:hypothetical protein
MTARRLLPLVLLVASLAGCAGPSGEEQRSPAVSTAYARQAQLTGGFPTPTLGALPTSTPAPTCASAVWWNQVRTRVGETITVQGEVLDARASTLANQSGVELSLGQRYPDPNRFVILVPNATVESRQPIVGRSVCAIGKVAIMDGLLGMALASAADLRPAQ